MSIGQRSPVTLRKAATLGEHIHDWIYRHRSLPAEEERSLVDETDCYRSRIAELLEAHEQGGGIGVASLRGASTHGVVGSLIEASGWQSDRVGHTMSLDAFRTISAGLDCHELGAAVRYQLTAGSTAPTGFPVRLELLSLIEVAEILALVYFSYFPLSRRSMPERGQIERISSAASETLAGADLAGAWSGFRLTRLQIVGLRERLTTRFREAPDLQRLETLGFWDELIYLVEHAEHRAVNEMLELLWGSGKELGWLFCELAAPLNETGHKPELYCTMEAVSARNSETGWPMPHRSSVIARQTIAELPDRGETVRASRPRSQVMALERARIAALTAELVVELHGSSATTGAPHIIELPALAPNEEVPLALHRAGVPSRSLIVDLYARAKTIYLQERAVRRGGITGLVVVTDASAPAAPQAPGPLRDWIDATQGEAPQQRARRRPTLFVMAATPDAGSRLLSDPHSRDFLDHSRAAVADLLSGQPDAASEWVPGRPFSNVLFYTETGTSAGELAQASGREASPAPTLLRARTPTDLLPAGTGSELQRALLRLMEPGTLAQEKGLQISEEAAHWRRQLRSRLARFASVVGGEHADMRRQSCSMILHHARACVAAGSSAKLQASLLPAPSALTGVCARAQRTDHELSDQPLYCSTLARAAIAHWFSELRSRSRSRQIRQASGITALAFAHLVDELAAASVRLDVTGGLTSTLEAVGNAESGRWSFDAARVIHWYIGSFAETLRLPQPLVSIEGRAGAAGGASGPVRLGQPAMRGQPTPVSQAVAFGDRWCDALAQMLDGNLSAMQMHGALRGGDELRELLVELSQASFEIGM